MQEKRGIVDISNLLVPPEKHELMTATYFANLGKDIVFIKPSNIPEIYRPDILMDGIEWEIKAPIGNGKKTINHNFHKASAQSRNIIFDLRRVGLNEKQCISQLEKEFDSRSFVKRLLVITKEGKLLKYIKK